MSVKHPVIAVTGSSGAGTTTVKNAFEHIFRKILSPPSSKVTAIMPMTEQP